MKTSAKGVAFIATEELAHPEVGKHITPEGLFIVYLDPVGLRTIAFGHLCKPGEDFSAGLNNDQAHELLAKDVDWAETAVNTHVRVGLSQDQFDALVSLVFNIGANAFATSTVLRKLNQGDYQGAADAFLMWKNAGGKPILLPRRQRERTVFLSTVAAVPVVSNQPVGEKEMSGQNSNIDDATRSAALSAVSTVAGFLNPALGIAMQVAPSLIRLFGSKDSEVTERNAKAAEMVGSVMKEVTQKDTYEGAATALQSDPALQTQFREQIKLSTDDIAALMETEIKGRDAATDRMVKIGSNAAATRVFNAVTKMQFTLTAGVILSVALMIGMMVYKSADGDIPGWAVGIANALIVAVALEWRNIVHAVVGKDVEAQTSDQQK